MVAVRSEQLNASVVMIPSEGDGELQEVRGDAPPAVVGGHCKPSKPGTGGQGGRR